MGYSRHAEMRGRVCTIMTFFARPQPKTGRASANSQFDGMLALVVMERNSRASNLLAIEEEPTFSMRVGGRPRDGDVINGFPVAIMDFVRRPGFRQARRQSQFFALEICAQ